MYKYRANIESPLNLNNTPEKNHCVFPTRHNLCPFCIGKMGWEWENISFRFLLRWKTKNQPQNGCNDDDDGIR